jgi:phospholipid transport system substrate-binding protein
MSTMFRGRRAMLAAALLAALVPFGALRAQQAIDNSSPERLVETAAKALLADLDANRATYRKDLDALYKSIDSKFMPYVDTAYTAGQVVGAPWRSATPEQRERFIRAFKQVMLSTYGAALLDFTARDFTIKPFRGDPAAKSAEVDVQIRRSNGAPVAVRFVLRNAGAGWKVWDVIIEGIRYVGVFRSDFEAELNQNGIEGVLARLESGKAPAR